MTLPRDFPSSQPPSDRRGRGEAQRFVSAYSQLLKEVRSAGLLRPAVGFYARRTLLMLLVSAASVLLTVELGDSWTQVVPAVVLAVAMAQFCFLGHDAAHHQIFDSRGQNDLAVLLIGGGLAGISHRWWQSKHSRHHKAPNHIGVDPDIRSRSIHFTPKATRIPWIRRHQGWLFLPLLCLEGVHLQAVSIKTACRGKDWRARVELLLLLTRLGVLLVIVARAMSPLTALGFLVVHYAVLGILTGGSFAPNHKGMPIVPEASKLDFLRRQVLMSRNVSGGPLIDFFMGGLNYQVEHHLFPSMPRPRLPQAQVIVKNFCLREAVPYTEMTLPASYAAVIGYLNEVGLTSAGSFECPIASNMRG